MKKDLNYYLNLSYETIVVRDDDFDGVYYYAYYKEYKYIKGTGEDEAKAIEDLKEAFKCALMEMLADGEKIKEPRSSIKNKTKNYAITMKENIMQEIDDAAKQLGISRSALLTISAKKYIQNLP